MLRIRYWDEFAINSFRNKNVPTAEAGSALIEIGVVVSSNLICCDLLGTSVNNHTKAQMDRAW